MAIQMDDEAYKSNRWRGHLWRKVLRTNESGSWWTGYAKYGISAMQLLLAWLLKHSFRCFTDTRHHKTGADSGRSGFGEHWSDKQHWFELLRAVNGRMLPGSDHYSCSNKMECWAISRDYRYYVIGNATFAQEADPCDWGMPRMMLRPSKSGWRPPRMVTWLHLYTTTRPSKFLMLTPIVLLRNLKAPIPPCLMFSWHRPALRVGGYEWSSGLGPAWRKLVQNTRWLHAANKTAFSGKHALARCRAERRKRSRH